MNSLQISYFLAVCKYNSFTETARKLYVSQPAVSKQIFALEEELGVRLFNREYKKINITEEGQIFREVFEKNIALLNEAKTKTYQMTHQNHYALKIAVLQGLEPSHLLYPTLQRFKQLHPDVNISLECLSHENLNSAIRLNQLDYVITLYPEVANDNLVHTHELYQTKLAFTVYQNHPFFNKTSLTKDDLKNQKILISTTGTKAPENFFAILQDTCDIKESQLISLSSIDEVISYLAAVALRFYLCKHAFTRKILNRFH